MNSISKNSAITFSSQILIFVSGLATSIILARALGPKGKGIYTLIILIPTVMLKLGSLGIEAANVYFTGSKKYKIEDIVSNSLLSSILLGSILFLLFFNIYHLSIFQNFLKSNQLNDIALKIAKIIKLPTKLIDQAPKLFAVRVGLLTASISLISSFSDNFRRICFSIPVINCSIFATCFLARGCINAVTVPVNKCIMVFSPQPKHAPSPQFIDE